MRASESLSRSAVLVVIAAYLGACSVGEIGTSVDGDPRTRGDADDPAPAPSAPAVQCPGASPDVAARNGWRSSEASEPADDSLLFEVKARPTADNLDGVVALGAEGVEQFDQAAIAVRFGADGLIDVRDGGTYASDVAYPYEPGVWYSIGIAADLATQTYDVEVGPCVEARETLIKDAAFRSNTEELSTWAVWSSQTAALEVSTPAWMASEGCEPATCDKLKHECGQPSDGCGGTLDCGSCDNTELCDSGLCVEELVTTPPSPACVPDTCDSLHIECGIRSDGCGDYIACGGCPSGSICYNDWCVTDLVPTPPAPACTPDTCQSLDRHCGTVSDGCGGSLSCGSCQSDHSCTAGYCVPNPVTPPTPPPPVCTADTCQSLDRHCGTVSNGCGGTLNCGGCTSGYSCNGGYCIQDPVTPPPPPPPPTGTNDFGQLIRNNAAGGVVIVPNGTYYISDVRNFAPQRPLVLVAESQGGVVVTRRSGAAEGQTSLHLDGVRDIAFVGIDFRYVTLRIEDSSDVHLWYTFHTYPAEQKPRPRHKVCGGGRSPDGLLMSNVRNVKFHGIELDRIGNDGIKLSAVRDAQLVGARLTNIHNQSYQTDTTALEAARCGQKPTDKLYHSDVIQIFPGNVHNFVMSDSFSDGHLVLQVESPGQSVSGFRIQDSWLSASHQDCVTINTRVKPAAGTTPMELIVVDSTSWCAPKAEKWHFMTKDTMSSHRLMVGNVTYETSKNAPSPTPADEWKARFPYEAWGCFVTEDIGWTQLGASCAHSGFPSYGGPSNTPTTRVIHSY